MNMKNGCKRIIAMLLCAVLVVNSNKVVSASTQGTNEEAQKQYVFKQGKLTQVYDNNQLISSYEYNRDNRLVRKVADGIYTAFAYDEEGKISSIDYNGKDSITYIYREVESTGALQDYDIAGFVYNNSYYNFIYDEYSKIVGISNNAGEQLVKYEYDESGKPNVKSYDGMEWVNNDDDTFIGNINKMLSFDNYYDEDVELYVVYRSFFDPVTKSYIRPLQTRDSAGNMARDWVDDELEAENLKYAYLTDKNYGVKKEYTNNWYEELSDVELIARLIYCENTFVTADQKAIAWVLINRSKTSGFEKTPVTNAKYKNAFASITGTKSNTEDARIPDVASSGWEYATFLACLMYVTLDETTWNTVVGKPSGISDQCYFVGYNYGIIQGNFKDSDGRLQYRMDGKWINITDVAIAGSGTCSNVQQIEDRGEWYNNIFFNVN